MLDEINGYIDIHFDNSISWADYIDEYSDHHKQYKPTIPKVDLSLPTLKERKGGGQHRKKIEASQHTAPTFENLSRVTKLQDKLVDKKYEEIKGKFNVNSSDWILYEGASKTELDTFRKNYPVGSLFDRPVNPNKSWETGTWRKISTVGAVVELAENQLVIFMEKNKGRRYVVTAEIIKVAEDFGIKTLDTTKAPSKEKMNKYFKFVSKQKSYRNNNKT